MTQFCTSSAESQKGVNDVQRCLVENQKGASLSLYNVYGDNALLVLDGISLKCVLTLLYLLFTCLDMFRDFFFMKSCNHSMSFVSILRAAGRVKNYPPDLWINLLHATIIMMSLCLVQLRSEKLCSMSHKFYNNPSVMVIVNCICIYKEIFFFMPAAAVICSDSPSSPPPPNKTCRFGDFLSLTQSCSIHDTSW